MWIEGRALYRRIESDATRSVTIALDLRGLTVRGLGGDEIAHWPFGRLERHTGRPALVIGPKGGVERIEVVDPPTRAAFEAALKAIPKADDPSIPRWVWTVVLGGAALFVALVWLVLWGLGLLAERIAPLIPREAVEALDAAGRTAVLDSLGSGEDRRCAADAGTRALARLSARLVAASGADDLAVDVAVYRAPIANAVALPAGSILVTDALIDLADTPDAFAGVVAHEIAHVRRGHGLQKVVHDGGIALAFGLITGDTGGVMTGATRALLGAAYSREAESEADRDAVDMLAGAGGDPARFAVILKRLSEGAEDRSAALALLDTHPVGPERSAEVLARAPGAERGPGPLMAEGDWAAIRAICR